jgi:arylsulfatase A-like enzyme
MQKINLIPMLCFATLPTLAQSENKPVNVVYILADDLGYGDLGCYGQKLIETPNIDRMAANGMLFTQHYAGCTVSAPSRCSLMTGLHTGHTQVRGNFEIKPEGQTPLDSGTYTLGKMFKDGGYVTGIFGKWGLGYPGSVSTPNKMGFDKFYGYNCQRKSHSFYPEYLWRNDEKEYLAGNTDLGRQTYSADLIHNEALKFIRANKQKPFFAMLTYTLPHAEINLPHDSVYDKYVSRFEDTPYVQGRNSSYFSSERPRASFAAMVERLDRYVGEVIEELKKQGLESNTLVILTSDNGPHHEGGADPDFFQSSGPLRGTKRDLYEGGIRVPMLAYCPSWIKAGTKTDFPCAFWDVMPTFAELIPAKLPVATDGISFLPTLKGKGKQKRHTYFYWEFHERGGKIAVRMGDWKGIKLDYGKHPDAAMLLFNLSTDIHEDNNVASKHSDVVKKMEAIIQSGHIESEIYKFGRK